MLLSLSVRFLRPAVSARDYDGVLLRLLPEVSFWPARTSDYSAFWRAQQFSRQKISWRGMPLESSSGVLAPFLFSFLTVFQAQMQDAADAGQIWCHGRFVVVVKTRPLGSSCFERNVWFYYVMGCDQRSKDRLLDMGTSICVTPSVLIWASLVGLSINRHSRVARVDCKQTRQYGPELDIDYFAEVWMSRTVAFHYRAQRRL